MPFNINPHYLDANPDDPHQGETREDRIKEFHAINDGPVLGLREGTYAAVDGNQAILRGTFNARLFTKSVIPTTIFARYLSQYNLLLFIAEIMNQGN